MPTDAVILHTYYILPDIAYDIRFEPLNCRSNFFFLNIKNDDGGNQSSKPPDGNNAYMPLMFG